MKLSRYVECIDDGLSPPVLSSPRRHIQPEPEERDAPLWFAGGGGGAASAGGGRSSVEAGAAAHTGSQLGGGI